MLSIEECNQLGYKIYLKEMRGYSFIPRPYSSDVNYIKYLNYYTNPEENLKLIESVSMKGVH